VLWLHLLLTGVSVGNLRFLLACGQSNR